MTDNPTPEGSIFNRRQGVKIQPTLTASAKFGISAEAVVFAERATMYREQATSRLRTSIYLGLAAIGYSIAVSLYFFSRATTDLDGTAISAGIAAVVPLTLLLFALSVAVRNYNAASHNATVNEQKADQLSIYETLVNGAESGDLRQQIMIEAARAIFSSTPTGFLKDGVETVSANPTVTVVEKLLSK